MKIHITISLRGGGTISIDAAAPQPLNADDRAFILRLLRDLTDYEAGIAPTPGGAK